MSSKILIIWKKVQNNFKRSRNREKSLQQKDNDLERKRKLEGTCQEKSDEERKHRLLEVERKSEKLQGKFAVQKRQ